MPVSVEPPVFSLEISPLSERHHTGIPNVAKMLALEVLRDDSVDGRFFFNRQNIPRSIVEQLVELDGGEIIRWLASRAYAPAFYGENLDRPIIGVYTSWKTHRRLFPFEVRIVHDLIPVIAPQFIRSENIVFENAKLLGDIASSDLIVAVSESTRMDLLTYFPRISHIPCIVAHLASSLATDVSLPKGASVEPYVLVLGTLEPRKNIEFILEFVTKHAEILGALSFVFVGRMGWGKSFEELVDAYDLEPHIKTGAIRFTGFVSDTARDHLVAHARCVVYASLYEGFGLPVVEALSRGVPVITGHGSSLPEAGGDVAVYCDVTSSEAFGEALTRCLADNDLRARSRRKAWADQFSWKKAYETIRDASLRLARAQTSR
jgi:glycosyltransferase involved in cell wall biosynthesis